MLKKIGLFFQQPLMKWRRAQTGRKPFADRGPQASARRDHGSTTLLSSKHLLEPRQAHRVGVWMMQAYVFEPQEVFVARALARHGPVQSQMHVLL